MYLDLQLHSFENFWAREMHNTILLVSLPSHGAADDEACAKSSAAQQAFMPCVFRPEFSTDI